MGRKKKEESYGTNGDLNADVNAIIGNLTKKFGEGSAFQIDNDIETYSKGVVSTGILSLDRALGIGGFPLGRVIEVFGPEMCGKSSLALKAAGEAQKTGIIVYFLDLEHALDMELASNCGVDFNKGFVMSQPTCGEEAFEKLEEVLSMARVFVVVDSVAALLPKAELDSGFMESTQLGRQAALMSEALRKLVGKISKSGSSVLFVNQTRQKIGSFFPGAVNTPGGNSLKFYSSIRIKVGKSGKIEQKDDILGHTARLKIEKNKLAAPYKEVEVDLYYGSGFCSTADMLSLAEKNDIVSKSGVWYAYGNERIGQGKVRTLEFLVQNPDVYKEIRNKVMEHFGLELRYEDMYIDRNIKMGESNAVDLDPPIGPENEEIREDGLDISG